MNADRTAASVSRRTVVGGALAALAVTGAAQGTARATTSRTREPWEPVVLPEQVPVTEYQVPVSGGGSLWCWDTGGDGEPVVLLHPGSGSGESRPYQQPVPAGAGFRVVGNSRRGAYGSVAGTRAESDTASGDLDTLADHLGLDRFRGATAVELSVNGYCGGPGNADLAATALAFEALYGVRTGIRTDRLTELARTAEALTGYQPAWNHPVTGTHAFCWGGMDLITQETEVDPLLHNCLEPTLVGNARTVPFTADSGPYTLIDKLTQAGVELTSAQVDDVLTRAREFMATHERLLTDEELVAPAEEER
ncbi:hypothetical protein ACWD3I_44100 [Streptomyces sp. NPDC002817]|uniref:hypothetical protein n=1 Tax=Streptomyces sp. NPDC088357 TaxID=3154655 RepID=UPI00344669B9